MQAYRITHPHNKPLPVVASIPHTGTYVPAEIEDLFVSDKVRQLPMTDWYLYELYDFLSDLGVSVISATYSRYVIDLNRSPVPLQLYPGRFETQLVAQSDFQGEPIFSTYPSDAQIETYKKTVHAPYHAALKTLLEETKKSFGCVYLLDLHSIAKQATLIHTELEMDIYLGNREGKSCSDEWFLEVERQYVASGLSVQKNSPYKGGYITHHYGQDARVEALQIEMNQEVYMDADDNARVLNSKKFADAKNRLKILFESLLQNLLHNREKSV